MKRNYKLEGLDCADCAMKLEAALSKIDGMDEVNINFVTLKCTMEASEERMDAVVQEALAVIRDFDGEIVAKRV